MRSVEVVKVDSNYPRLPRILLDILVAMELDKRSGNVVLNYRDGRLMGCKREEHFPLK